MTIANRIDRISDHFRPRGCQQSGPSCVVAWHLRTEEDDPSNPPPDTICPRCGRGRLVREIVVVGADAAMIAAL